MEERVFRVTPLTPVHIGAGETYGPEEYRIEAGGGLVRLNVAAILESWRPERRREFERRIEANDLTGARQMVHESSRGRPEFELYRTALGRAAERELKKAADPTRRRGEIHALCRNAVTGQPVLPGSSIKGAMRTAIVNACAAHNEAVQGRVREELARYRGTAWQTLEEGALRYKRARTESDPLSYLRVCDGVFPAECVQVDRVVVRTRQEREVGRGIQMHFERLLARSDSPQAPSCRIGIALAAERMRHPDATARLRLSWDFLIGACEAFYRRRRQEELEQFGWLDGGPLPPSPPGGLLWRVGRFCHFESLSVDGLRSGWNVQRRRPIVGMGASRSVIESGGRFLPFGWLLLEPERGG